MGMATVRKRYRDAAKTKFMGWQADYFDQHGTRHAKLFKLEREAKTYLKKVVREVDAGTHTADNKSITVEEAAQQWLARPISRRTGEKIEKSTRVQYENHARRYISPRLGTLKLSQLNTPRVEDFVDELIKAKISPPMTRKILASLKSVISEAQRRGQVGQNVALPCSVAVNKRAEREIEEGVDFPSHNEVNRIITAAGPRWRALLITAALTGMRAGELRGLRWVDVDFENGLLKVRQRADAWKQIGAPKSKSSRREIPMPAGGMVANTLRLWRGDCPKGALDLVFPNGRGNVEDHSNILARGLKATQIGLGITKPAFDEEGEPIMEPALDERKKPIVDADGNPIMRQAMKAKYSMHKLRHYFASARAAGGADLKRVQAWMGHGTFSMTADTYSHLFKNKEADAAIFEESERALTLHATKTT